jgi:hypothetical protein
MMVLEKGSNEKISVEETTIRRLLLGGRRQTKTTTTRRTRSVVLPQETGYSNNFIILLDGSYQGTTRGFCLAT